MPAINLIPDFWRALAHKEVDLRVAGDQLALRFTATYSAVWTSLLSPGLIAAVAAVPMTFPDLSVSVTGSGLNLGGDGKMDIVIADKTLVATGGPAGPFQYVWLADTVSPFRLVGYYDYGAPITVENGQSFIVEFNDAANRAFSISG